MAGVAVVAPHALHAKPSATADDDRDEITAIGEVSACAREGGRRPEHAGDPDRTEALGDDSERPSRRRAVDEIQLHVALHEAFRPPSMLPEAGRSRQGTRMGEGAAGVMPVGRAHPALGSRELVGTMPSVHRLVRPQPKLLI